MMCTASTCLDAAAAAWMFGAPMLCWALGYGIGQAVQWTRRIRDAA